VRSNEHRYRSAWLEGVIMAVYVPPGRGRRYKIRYDPYNFELLTDDGQPLTEEDVSATQVRPIPPSFSEKDSYSVGDVVEFYDKGCWWLGTVIQVLHAAKYFLIHNPHSGLCNEFDLSQLRDAKLWSKERWSLLYSQVCYCLYVILGFWTLVTLMENLYLVHPMISVMVLAKNHFQLVADL